MKLLSRIILIVAVAAIGYGYPGAFTRAGSKVYDERDALLPFFNLIAGVGLLIAFLIMVVVGRRKKNKLD